MIKVENIRKTYGETVALNNISLEVKDGEFFIITGRSGSGKSTLMKIMSGLLSPTSGIIKVDNLSLNSLSEKERCFFRNKTIGYVFQSFGLEDNYTAYENIELPLVISGLKQKIRKKRIEDISQIMGLTTILNKPTRLLSGGEKQRVSIARAIINAPKYLFADEPCGNLDSENTKVVLKKLKELSENGITIVMVTHEISQLILATHSIELIDGKIANEKFYH